MAEHVTQWLGAYHDGELAGARLRQVEAHLAECTLCQAGLEEIRDLSSLLQGAPPWGDFLPIERFVADLNLNLPRQSVPPQPRNALKTGWWLIPAGLLGIWLFIDISRSLSTVAGLAADILLLSGNVAWLQGNPLQMKWFATALDLFGSQLGAPAWEILAVLNDANLFLAQLAGRLVPQAILAVSYLAWLCAWWLRRQPQRSPNGKSLTR